MYPSQYSFSHIKSSYFFRTVININQDTAAYKQPGTVVFSTRYIFHRKGCYIASFPGEGTVILPVFGEGLLYCHFCRGGGCYIASFPGEGLLYCRFFKRGCYISSFRGGAVPGVDMTIGKSCNSSIH